VHGLVVVSDAGELTATDSVKGFASAAPAATSPATTNSPGRSRFWRALGAASAAAAAGAGCGRRTRWWVSVSPWVLRGVFGDGAAAIVLLYGVLERASSALPAALPRYRPPRRRPP